MDVPVVHLDTGRAWRGGQQQVFLLHRELVRRGVDSTVLACSAELIRRCAAAGLAARPLPGARPWRPSVIQAVRATVSSDHLVHAHDPHSAALAAACRLAGRGRATVCHRRVSFPVRRPARRLTYRGVNRWIAVSQEIRSILVAAGVPTFRVAVVPSAVDLEAVAVACSEATGGGSADDEVRIAAVAALDPHKGHEVLLAALPSILAAEPGLRCLVVGDGPNRTRLERAAAAAGIAGAVRFLGHRDDVPAVMRRCRVVVAPSLAGEGSSAVLKEAMAVGTPLVASSLGANLEVVGDACLAVQPGDPRALADAVVRLLRDPALSAELVRRGRSGVQRFTPESMTDATLEVYGEVV